VSVLAWSCWGRVVVGCLLGRYRTGILLWIKERDRFLEFMKHHRCVYLDGSRMYREVYLDKSHGHMGGS